MQDAIKFLYEDYKVMAIVDNQKPVDDERWFVPTVGVVLDFAPSKMQLDFILDNYPVLDAESLTLFDRALATSPTSLASMIRDTAQLSHYSGKLRRLESANYHLLNTMTLEARPLTHIKGVDLNELGEMIRGSLYSGMASSGAERVAEICKVYNIRYDINQVKNNEMRVILFDNHFGFFNDGDDVLRYLFWKLTGSAEMNRQNWRISQLKAKVPENEMIVLNTLEAHKKCLAKCFNRNKRIIMGIKVASQNRVTKRTINEIGRMSKTLHMPWVEPAWKTFIRDAYDDDNYDYSKLSTFPLKERFRLLNLIAYKRLGIPFDTYQVRSGKQILSKKKRVLARVKLDIMEHRILASVVEDTKHLLPLNIKLDSNIDYGLPISGKQTLGKLPFGTRISSSPNKKLSIGTYWIDSDNGRETDLDLSVVNAENRQSWDTYRRGKSNEWVEFSGDLTSAPHGAVEFMNFKDSYLDLPTGLFLNVYTGNTKSNAKLFVGDTLGDKNQWRDRTFIQEDYTTSQVGNVLGVAHGNEFIVYMTGRGSDITSRDVVMDSVARANSGIWTLKRLLTIIGYNFAKLEVPDVEYDVDLTYANFTLDKLEEMMYNVN